MSEVGRGATKTLDVQFYAYAGGPAADPTGVTLNIYFGDALVAGPLTYDSGQISRVSTGAYTYDWDVPGDAALGDYRAVWTGTINGSTVTGTEYFEVIASGDAEAGITSLIIGVDEAQEVTGRMLSRDDLLAAQGIIELAANRNIQTDTFGKADTRWIKRAVAYQAAWMEDHPEAATAMDVESISQADLSVTHRKERDTLYLAPLAKACLRRLTWMRSRSISLATSIQGGVVRDDDLAWKAL